MATAWCCSFRAERSVWQKAIPGRQIKHNLADSLNYSSSVPAVLRKHNLAESAKIRHNLAENTVFQIGFCMNTYEITTWANPGIVGQDAEGNPWITWDGPPTICDECGAEIDRGYARGKWGEQQFYCCSHIKKTDKYGPQYGRKTISWPLWLWIA
jgi:hypothetical protein